MLNSFFFLLHLVFFKSLQFGFSVLFQLVKLVARGIDDLFDARVEQHALHVKAQLTLQGTELVLRRTDLLLVVFGAWLVPGFFSFLGASRSAKEDGYL